MIIRSKNLYSYLSVQPTLTALCTVYNSIPPEVVITGTYIFLEKLSDNLEVASFQSQQHRTSRFAISIVSKKALIAGEDPEDIIHDIIDELDRLLIDGPCVKVPNMDGIHILSITDGGASPILMDDKARKYAVRDYLLTYSL